MPQAAEAYAQKALYLHVMGQHAAAVPIFDHALYFAPRDDGIYYNRACACARNGDRQGTLWSLWQAIQLRPGAKETPKNEDDFQSLRQDPEFLRMVMS
jgi:Flp pilus assembly protein TadD